MENQNQITLSSQSEIARIEIDTQIATARTFPRNVAQIVKEVEFLATLDRETAESCFYALPRKEKQPDGSYKTKMIEGISIRLAEIIFQSWEHVRISDPIVTTEGQTVTVIVKAADLQKNCVAPGMATRPFYNFPGSKELAIANAYSTAKRNAILGIIPKGLFASTIQKIKEFSVEKVENEKQKSEKTFKNSVEKMFKTFDAKGITKQQIFELLEIEEENQISNEHLISLRNIITAVKDGMAKFEDYFQSKNSIDITEINKENLFENENNQ